MSVLVYVETRDGVVKKAGIEALSEGKRIAAKRGTTTAALLVGTNLDAGLEEVKKIGPDKIFVVVNAELSNYQAEGYLAAVKNAAEDFGANVIMMGTTSLGRDLAPRIAAKMQVMLIPDVIAINVEDDGNIVMSRPVYAGKVILDIKSVAFPVVISTRPNIFDVEEGDGACERVDLSPEFSLMSKVIEVVASEGGKLDVTEADRIVAGGRGLRESDNFKLVEDLADVLGAAVGASRAVVDSDWRPHSEQIGQTGKTVGPTLYFAVGISGAVQHMAGMKTSKVVVAINKDADAPIFKAADYGIVGDAMEVLPALIEELKK